MSDFDGDVDSVFIRSLDEPPKYAKNHNGSLVYLTLEGIIQESSEKELRTFIKEWKLPHNSIIAEAIRLLLPPRLIEKLIENGANVNLKDSTGYDSIAGLVYWQSHYPNTLNEYLTVIIKAGGNIDTRLGSIYLSVLERAFHLEEYSCIPVFLKHGISINMPLVNQYKDKSVICQDYIVLLYTHVSCFFFVY